MSEEHKSELISRLNKEVDEDKIELILEEIENVINPIFLYPIYDKYKSLQKSTISHYFLSTLEMIDSPDVLKIAHRIFLDPDTKESDLPWVLPIFIKHQSFNSKITSKVGVLLKKYAKKRGNVYELGTILRYLKACGMLSNYTKVIRIIVENKEFERRIRKIALEHLVKDNPASEFDYFAGKVRAKVDDEILQILLAQLACSWTNPAEAKLRKALKKHGSRRAKELIGDLLLERTHEEIKDLRRKVNQALIPKLPEYIRIFPENVILFPHTTTPRNKKDLIVWCIDFRSLLQDVDKGTKNHGYADDEIKTILPDVNPADYGKSLNRLHLYLEVNKIKVNNLFGLRKINRIVSLLATHPEEKDELERILKENRCFKLYHEEKWSEIQMLLLKRFITVLKKMKGRL